MLIPDPTIETLHGTPRDYMSFNAKSLDTVVHETITIKGYMAERNA